MIEFLTELLGFYLIWFAVGLGRKPDSSYSYTDIETWIQFILIISGIFLITST